MPLSFNGVGTCGNREQWQQQQRLVAQLAQLGCVAPELQFVGSYGPNIQLQKSIQQPRLCSDKKRPYDIDD